VHATFLVAFGFGFGLLVLDVLIIRLVVGMFNRERLITGNVPTRDVVAPSGFDSLR
jgi:hypothetical protein